MNRFISYIDIFIRATYIDTYSIGSFVFLSCHSDLCSNAGTGDHKSDVIFVFISFTSWLHCIYIEIQYFDYSPPHLTLIECIADVFFVKCEIFPNRDLACSCQSAEIRDSRSVSGKCTEAGTDLTRWDRSH